MGGEGALNNGPPPHAIALPHWGRGIGNAVHVMRIATGEIEETPEKPKSAAAELGKKGGAARAKKLSKKRRAEIAKKAANARWNS